MTYYTTESKYLLNSNSSFNITIDAPEVDITYKDTIVPDIKVSTKNVSPRIRGSKQNDFLFRKTLGYIEEL